MSGQLHAPAALPYPLDRRLGGPHRRSGEGGEEKNFQALPGLESQIIQRLAQRFTAELFGSLPTTRYYLYLWVVMPEVHTAPWCSGNDPVEYQSYYLSF